MAPFAEGYKEPEREMLLRVTVGKGDFQAYLRTLSPIQQHCYARHIQGATTQQIGRELFLDADAVRDMLIAIIVMRRKYASPIVPAYETAAASRDSDASVSARTR